MTRARDAFHFGTWPGDASLARLMCNFDTSEADVDELVAAVHG